MKKLLLILALMLIAINANAQSCPDDNHPHAIDLGLPSGTLWACCNVGATKPEEKGGYYAWGETEVKDNYDENSYKYYQKGSYVNLGNNISGSQYDVAHVKWGGSWQMPTEEQFKELFEYSDRCEDFMTTGLWSVNGIKIKSRKNGKSIFLCGAGFRRDNEFQGGTYGCYWTSTHKGDGEYAFNCWGSVTKHITGYLRFIGASVRPVCKLNMKDNNKAGSSSSKTSSSANIKSYSRCPDNNHPHAIDLGLPSGTLWACCNVGANKPEGYGGYYAWGETQEKSVYNWSTYKYCNKSRNTCKDIGQDISGTQYDVAYVKWGSPWQMPDEDEYHELDDNCTKIWTTFNGVKGCKLTSKINGGSIFLPAAGDRYNSKIFSRGEWGNYKLSSQSNQKEDSRGFCLFKDCKEVLSFTSYRNRDLGDSVRPVCK